MFKSWNSMFEQNQEPATSAGRETVFVETVVSIFDGMDGHLADLLAKEAETKAAHLRALEALRDYKANLKARYENQLQSIKELIAE